ncbi:hypothetical protein T484DRAFT_1935431 [Baffinella frigidus]|nr:hypothetical protein T484DRAFT_1935431 [Cryptophyta sp. CCMP2293]
MVYGVWCMVYGVWYMVYGVWCRVQGAGCRVWGLGWDRDLGRVEQLEDSVEPLWRAQRLFALRHLRILGPHPHSQVQFHSQLQKRRDEWRGYRLSPLRHLNKLEPPPHSHFQCLIVGDWVATRSAEAGASSPFRHLCILVLRPHSQVQKNRDRFQKRRGASSLFGTSAYRFPAPTATFRF